MGDRIKDGGPAFPTPMNAYGETSQSMSLRDWFAGQALIGLIANPNNSGSADEAARIAFGTADAMLRARSVATPAGGEEGR